MPRSQHCAVGKSGEDLACQELASRGYAILERRYRTRAGEIDIVARDRTALVFVEVKTRQSIRCGVPADAVTRAKRRRIVLMASDYVARRRPRAASCRFDVVTVCIDGDGTAVVDVIPGAFTADE
jgi:putative endonuclease